MPLNSFIAHYNPLNDPNASYECIFFYLLAIISSKFDLNLKNDNNTGTPCTFPLGVGVNARLTTLPGFELLQI